jgi:hypothetical protein
MALEGIFIKVIPQIIWQVRGGLYSRYRRHNAIKRAFEGNSSRWLNPSLDTALRDIEQFIGSGLGVLDADFAEFLRAFRDTEIPVRMLQAKLLSATDEGSRSVFGELFRTHFGVTIKIDDREIGPELLYTKLSDMLVSAVTAQGANPFEILTETQRRAEINEFVSADRGLGRHFFPHPDQTPRIRPGRNG